jgi:hypothetical protein
VYGHKGAEGFRAPLPDNAARYLDVFLGPEHPLGLLPFLVKNRPALGVNVASAEFALAPR